MSGSTFGLKSQGWIVSGSAYTTRLALRTPVSLPQRRLTRRGGVEREVLLSVVEIGILTLHLVQDRHGAFVTHRARERIVGLQHQALMDRSVTGSNRRCGSGQAGKEDQERLQRDRSRRKRLGGPLARLVRSVVRLGPASLMRAPI